LGCICHKLPLTWRLCAVIGGSGLSLASLRSHLLPEIPMNYAVLNFCALKLTDPKQNPYSCNTCMILIIVQRGATQSSLFIILQVHTTCFGCQPHPSSGVQKTVTAASGTCHIFLCSCLPPS